MDMRKLLPCGTKMHGTLIPLPLSTNCSRLGYFHRLFPIIGQGNRTVPLERHHPPCTHHVILHGPRIPRTSCNGIIAYPKKLTDRSPDSLFPIKGKGQDRRAKCLATVIRINPHRKTTNGTRAVNRKTTAFTRSQRSRQIERTFSSRKRSINTRCSFRQLLIDSSYQPGILLQLFGRERNHLDRRSISAVIDSIVYNGLTLNFPLRSNLQVRRFDSHLAPLGIRYWQI